MSSWERGTYFCENPHHALLHRCLEEAYPGGRAHGIAVEFGVGDGASIRCIARYMDAVGFDSFQGLPEDWRPGYNAGRFAADEDLVRATVPPNVRIVTGLFETTAPLWAAHESSRVRTVGLIHLDADLYSSTKTALDAMTPFILRDKPLIIFDEFYGYPECEKFEQRAWMEFCAENGEVKWDVIGCGIQQWGIKIT